MKINEEKYFIGSLYVGIVGLGLSIFVFSTQIISLNNNKHLDLFLVKEYKAYINKNGEQWFLPTGLTKFQVVQAATNKRPVFLEGEIDPPDVHVGDTQWLRVIVQSPVGIKQVTAQIETDTGIKEVPLNKVGTVSYRDMEPNKYLVQNGVLEILSTRQAKKLHNQKIAQEKKSLLKKANAQEGDKEKWENSWIVHDTHNTTYKTTFIVEDNAGLTNTLTLAWSDLCGIPINGNPGKDWKLSELGQHCTIPSGVEGIERNDIYIDNDWTLTINGGTFVFNPDKKIVMQGGTIAIFGGQIKKTYMWFCDKDGDGRTPNGTIGTIYAQNTAPISACGGGGGNGTFNNLYKRIVNLFNFTTPKATAEEYCGPTQPVWASRRYLFVEGQTDCYEGSANAHQGVTGFCETDRGDGSWDYNCVNGQEKQFENISSIVCRVKPAPPNDCQKNCNPLSGEYGWQNSAPNCGQSGLYSNGCEDTNYEGCIRLGVLNDCQAYCNKSYACTESVPTWSQVTQKCK